MQYVLDADYCTLKSEFLHMENHEEPEVGGIRLEVRVKPLNNVLLF